MANREGTTADLNNCIRPLPYDELNAEISKLSTGTMQPFPEITGEGRTPGGYVSLLIRLRQIAGNLIKLDKAQPGLISHRWDKEQGRFVIGYTLGGDACPAGEKQLTSFLVAPANVGRHISSSLHNHLLSLMECGEDTATAKWYVEQMCAEAEAIEGKCQFVDVIGNDGVAVGHAVEFRLFGFVGDQKFFATVAGEVNHALEFPSPFVDVSKDTLKCPRWKVVDDRRMKSAFRKPLMSEASIDSQEPCCSMQEGAVNVPRPFIIASVDKDDTVHSLMQKHEQNAELSSSQPDNSSDALASPAFDTTNHEDTPHIF